MRTQANDDGHSWPSRELDAVRLSAQLRAERLTVVQGPHGSGKTSLLLRGLLPLLQRRASDIPAADPIRASENAGAVADSAPSPDGAVSESTDASDTGSARTSGSSRVVVPFPDRRKRAGRGSSQDGEVVVYLDAWALAPVDAAWRLIHESLRLEPPESRITSGELLQKLVEWQRDRGVRFLVVLDDFDRCLQGSTDNVGASDFIDFWVQALISPTAPAHFIVALSEPAEALWRLLQQHQVVSDNLADHRLDLSASPLEPPLARSLAKLAESQAAPAVAQDVESDDGQAAYPDSDFPNSGDADEPDHHEIPARQALATSAFRQSDSAGADRVAHFRQRTPSFDKRSVVMVAIGVVAVMAVTWSATRLTARLWQNRTPEPTSTAVLQRPAAPAPPAAPRVAAAPPAAVPAVATPVPLSQPGFELVADAGDKSDEMIVSDMARLLTPRGSTAPTIAFPSGWASGLAALSKQPRLSIVTYDVLQAAHKVEGAAALQVIAPLFSEEVYFVVRNDSPLRYIHQIRDARLNAGPEGGSRSLTASGIYKRMFGIDPAKQRLDQASREEGLEQVLARKSDVLVLVGAQPDPWLVGLAPEKRQQLRVLQLDPANEASRRATSTFLPTRVTPDKGSGLEAADGTRTLALMTFLVTGSSAVGGNDEQVRAAANAICRNLPGLQQSGHPKWREVHPDLRLETGWPVSQVAADVFRECPNPKP